MELSSLNWFGAEPPRFVPCRPEQLIETGFHVARRHSWRDKNRWVIVHVLVEEDAEGCLITVFQPHSARPESWRDWEFRYRVIGLDRVPSEPAEMPVIEDAIVLH